MRKPKVVLPDTNVILLAKGKAENIEVFSFDADLRSKRT
jgi:hypothetical protein